MKILKKIFKFSFIYFLIYPNKVLLTDSTQKEHIKWNPLDNSSYEINKPKWEKIDDFDFEINNEPKWEKIDDFHFPKEIKNKLDFSKKLQKIENWCNFFVFNKFV